MNTERRDYFPAVRLLVLAAALFAPADAGATPANRAALQRHFDTFLAANLRTCSACHLPSELKAPESLDQFPHNPFGTRLRAARRELADAGKPTDIPARVAHVADEDSDGDGAPNLPELLLGHSPGDAKDTPSETELRGADAKAAEFRAFLASDRWRPFEPVRRPDVPHVGNAAWVRNPIDAFIATEHERRGLTPRPEAPESVLLRRVYLDLVGMNPTPAEIEAFEDDSSPDAYERLVDRLLADPRYGERWGRHWMDVWRYSDWAGWVAGGQIRDSQPHIWRWRDWIVESLNADKGYDQMAREMLAADELYPEDADRLRATGFLARNYKKLSREQWLEDTVNHTSRAFLGVTMHCAKCHDHLHDPVSQREYYRFRAVFEPHDVRLDRVPGETDTAKDGLPRVYDKELEAPTYFFVRGDERRPDKERGALPPGVPEVLGGAFAVEAREVPPLAAHPDRRPFVIHDLVAAAERAAAEARKAHDAVKDDAKAPEAKKQQARVGAALAEAKHRSLLAVLSAEKLELDGAKGTEPWGQAAREALRRQREVAVLEATRDLLAAQQVRGEHEAKLVTAAKAGDRGASEKVVKELEAARKKAAEAEKALTAAAGELAQADDTAYKPRPTDDYPERTTGRRTALAKWLTDRRNPLTARVAVNHIWLRHFGQGIVPTPDDFGAGGRPPSHPMLLDWLAAELMEPTSGPVLSERSVSKWSMKAVHRLIVTSSTYRMASTADPSNAAIDPDNVYLWRVPSRRLEAEAVRDNVLWVSGELDLTRGGPEIDHKQGLASKRRSIYLRVAPEREVEFLKVFDGPSTTECYQRKQSVVPQQALALGNSELTQRQAAVLAKKLSADAGEDDARFVERAFLHVLARRPSDEEWDACASFLRGQDRDRDRTRENLLLVLFNHNDFVTVR